MARLLPATSFSHKPINITKSQLAFIIFPGGIPLFSSFSFNYILYAGRTHIGHLAQSLSFTHSAFESTALSYRTTSLRTLAFIFCAAAY